MLTASQDTFLVKLGEERMCKIRFERLTEGMWTILIVNIRLVDLGVGVGVGIVDDRHVNSLDCYLQQACFCFVLFFVGIVNSRTFLHS